MRKLKLLLFGLIISISSFAQIEVVSFEHLQTDLTANTKGTMQYDQNGEKCAIIKIRTIPIVVKDFTYDVGRLGIVDTQVKGAEIWLYVPHSVRKISISHEKLGFIDKYDLGIPVKKGQTYLLTLKVNSVQAPIDTEEIKEQYLTFQIEPQTALVRLAGELLVLNNGEATKKLPLGTYDYRVDAPDFHSEVGKITISNPDEPTKYSVKLRPAYGWLDLSGEGNFNNAVVYLDNKLLGKAPLVTDKIASGEHTLLLQKNRYNSYEKKITISDNDTLKMSPKLTGNFAFVDIQVVDGAEIWINHEIKGTSSWKGELEYGRYVIEAKKESYYTTSTTCVVEPGDTAKSVIISDLKPIYGKLDIQVLPSGSKVYVDGEYKGETPYFHDEIIGNHLIEVKRDGMATMRVDVLLRESEMRKIAGKLSNGPVKTVVNSELEDVVVYVDGHKKGSTPWSGKLSLGYHKFEFNKEGFEPVALEDTIHYEGQTLDVPAMSPILSRVAFYMLPDGSDIYIDDEHKGVTPIMLDLPVGHHTVKITKKGMRPYVHPIYVTEGFSPEFKGELRVATEKDLKGEYAKDILYEDYERVSQMKNLDDSLENLKGYRKTLRKFYYSAGGADMTVLKIGGVVGNGYSVEASLFDFRVKMLEFSLFNMSAYSKVLPKTMDEFQYETQYLAYTPTLRLHFPLSRKWTLFFAGAPVITFTDGNIYDTFYKREGVSITYRGDVGFRFDSGHAFGVDFFARYQKDCGIMGGLSLHFTTNGKRARDLKNSK